ncbi:MAG TPA: N-acetylmuramoyl-L-alanine amidase [Steroidobacteraceae bacterium]|jgi:N-acetylmuramoyl-L-alanine amidase
MKRHVFVAALLGAVLAAGLPWAPAVAGPVTQVRAVGATADDSAASISLHLSARASFQIVQATNPARLAVIVHHARSAPGLVLPQPRGIVTGVTSREQSDGNLRLTIFLSRPLSVRCTWESATSSAPTLLVRLYPAMHRRISAASGAAAVDSAPRPVQAAHAPRESGRDIMIAVDAGHGGEDPGATGHAGTHEKDVVLAIARLLARRINGEPGMHAVLTRDRDEFLTLRERIQRARTAKADLFVSIHADSIANSAVSGSSVYVLSERGATNEAARWLAERENAADLMGGVSLADKGNTLASVLLDLSQQANISASMSAAHSVLGALEGVGLVRKPQVQQAGFVVLKSPDIPSMLVETAYISNPAEERRLRNPMQQAALADAIFAGLRSYFVGNPPAGTRFALARESHAPAVLAGTGAPGD